LDEFALEKGFIGCLRVSAKTDSNIASIFSQLVRQMLIKEITEQQAEEADPAFQLKQQTPMSDLERERLASF
jgi:hypothetical protein